MLAEISGLTSMPAFRSQLEIKVASELDHQGVKWEFESPAVLPDGRIPRYLPDFTIRQAREELDLPLWLECKPQEFLYSLRDLLGITRQYGERFAGDIACRNVSSEHLKSLYVAELWKPKMLAELTGESVLIVGTVGGTSSLSVQMTKDEIKFSRSHPFVNWIGIKKAKERKERELRWKAEAEQRQRQWQLDKLEREAEFLERKKIIYQRALKAKHLGPTKFDKHCCACEQPVYAGTGSLRKILYANNASKWQVICPDCLED